MSGSDDFETTRRLLLRLVPVVCPRWPVDRRDDLVQIVLVKLVTYRQRKPGADNEGDGSFPPSYLKKALYHAMIDEIRRDHSRPEMQLDEELEEPMISDRPGPQEQLAESELGNEIYDCLQQMVRSRQRALTLYLLEYSVPEAAEELGWDRKRTENLVYRGLAELRRCLEKKGYRH